MNELEQQIAQYAADRYIEKNAGIGRMAAAAIGSLGGGALAGLTPAAAKASKAYRALRAGKAAPGGFGTHLSALGVSKNTNALDAIRKSWGKKGGDFFGHIGGLGSEAMKNFSLARGAAGGAAGGIGGGTLASVARANKMHRYAVPAAAAGGGLLLGSALSK